MHIGYFRCKIHFYSSKRIKRNFPFHISLLVLSLYDSFPVTIPANTLRKSNVILWLYFGNLRKLLSANDDVT